MLRTLPAATFLFSIFSIGGAIVPAPAAAQAPKPAAPPKMPAKLTEVAAPAGPKVTQLHPPIAVPLAEFVVGPSPAYLNGAVVLTRPIAKYAPDPAAGVLEIEATQDGPMLLAVSWIYDGYAKGRWLNYTFCDHGWVPLTKITLFNTANARAEPHDLYLRECKAGDKFRIQTRVNHPPLLIVPAAAASVPKIVDLEPDPKLPESFQYDTVRAKAIALLDAERLAELETWTAGYLRDDAHFPSGRYKLTETYRGISDYVRNYEPAAFVRRLAVLEKYVQAYPATVAGRLMLANCSMRYVVNLEYDENAQDRSAKIDELRRRTLEVLHELEQQGVKSPDVYTTLMLLAGTQGWDDELKVGYIESCLATGKWCPDVVVQVCVRLNDYRKSRRLRPDRMPPLPKRSPDEDAIYRQTTERLLEAIAKHVTPRFDDAPYAVAYADYYINNPYAPFMFAYVEWPRMKRSFEDLEKHFPDSRRNTLLFCRYACAADDRATAKTLFQRLGEIDVEEENVWSTRSAMLADRAWAQDDHLSGDQRRVIEVPSTYFGAVAWFDDGKRLLLGNSNGFLYTCDEAAGAPEPIIEATVQRHRLVRFSPDRKFAWVGAGFSNLSLIRLEDQAKRKILVDHKDVTDLRFLPGGERGLVGFEDGIIQLYDLTADDIKEPIREFNLVEGKQIRLIAPAADGKTATVIGAQAKAVTFDLATGEPRRTWAIGKNGCLAADVSSDGGQFVAITGNNRLQLWDIAGEAPRWDQPMPTPRGSCVAFSADNRLVAVGTGDLSRIGPAEIRIYAAADGRLLKTLKGHKAAVLSLAFSPDGKTLASGSEDRSVRLWDVPSP